MNRESESDATEHLMNNDTYLTLILEFSSSKELITAIILLSKYHHQYIHSAKHCHQLINRILHREFGCVISEEMDSKTPFDVLSAIHTMHNYWDQTKVNSKLNFMHRIMSHYKQWTVYALRHFMTKISKKHRISIKELSFNNISEEFEALPLELHNNHIIHLLWNETLQIIDDDDANGDHWMSDDEDNDSDDHELQKYCDELEKYIEIIYWMNQHKEYHLNQEDIFTFYRVFPWVSDSIKAKMLKMMVTPETLMTQLLSFLLDIVEQQRPITLENIYDDFDRIWPKWTAPFIEYLLPDIVRYAVKCAQLNEEYVEGTSIDPEVISRRWVMSDIIMEIADIIGQHRVYDIFYDLLNVDAPVPAPDWRYYEAVLFCIATHSKVTCLDSIETKQHPLYNIFASVIKIRPTLLQIKMVWNRCIDIFAHHCGFIGVNDYVLKQYFDAFIVCGLQSDDSSAAAGNAFRRFCEEYRGKHLPSIYIQSVYNIYVHSSDHRYPGRINIKQEIAIIIGLSTIFAGFDDAHDMEEAVQCLIQIPYKHLCVLICSKQQQQEHEQEDEAAIIEVMKKLSTFFKFFKLDRKHIYRENSVHLSLKALLRMWPQISYLLSHHSSNDDVMEASIRCLKHVIRECCSDYKECKLFLAVFKEIIHLYCNISQRSSFLYLLSIYLDEYSTNTEKNVIFKLFCSSLPSICSATFKIASNERLFVSNHFIIEDFYEMVKVYMKMNRAHVFSHNMYCIKWIFEMGINGLLLESVNAHIAVTSFYQQFFDFENSNNQQNKPFVDEIYAQFGAALVHKIIFGLSGNIKSESRAKELAELLNSIYVYNKSQCKLFMTQQLRKEMDESQSKQMICTFCNASSKKQRLRTLMNWYYTK